MATTIGALRYDLLANVQPFMRAMSGVRRDLSTTTRLLNASRTPMERYKNSLNSIRNSYRKGKIDAEQYRRAVKMLKTEMREMARQRAIESRLGAFAGTGLPGMALLTGGVAGGIATGVGAVTMGVSKLRQQLTDVREEMEELDKLAKRSRLFGVSANELSGLRLAGSQAAGMDSNQVDMSIQRFTRRAAEFEKGTGEAIVAFKRLGITAEQIRGLDSGQRLRLVADRMALIGDEAEQLRVGFKLFDSEGAKFVLALKDGAEGLDKFLEKSKALGEAVSDKELANIEAANDALDDLDRAMGSLYRSAAIMLAPALRDLANLATAVSIQIRRVAQFEVGGGTTVGGAAGDAVVGTLLGSKGRAALALWRYFSPQSEPSTGSGGEFADALADEAGAGTSSGGAPGVSGAQAGSAAEYQLLGRLRRSQYSEDEAKRAVKTREEQLATITALLQIATNTSAFGDQVDRLSAERDELMSTQLATE